MTVVGEVAETAAPAMGGMARGSFAEVFEAEVAELDFHAGFGAEAFG